MSKPAAKEIKLSRLLKEDLIDLELQEDNKNKLLARLVELIAKSGKLKDKKAFLKAILERERMGSTGIGNGVAIPHAKSRAVKEMVLAFAKVQQGIEFGALDGEKVFLLFMLASPQDFVGEHLKILADIAGLIRDKFIIGLLKKSKNKKEAFKIIRSHKK